ncbi:putative vinorine synthase [Helianthus debilis subsp. tardiflorus]
MIHTIISRETIKPSSPTPSHLHTYNLSEMDLISQKSYMRTILFYPNNRYSSLTAEEKATLLKESLSQSLAMHYPFAGRLPTPASPYVDCNDEGVLFLEARNDGQLDTFQRMSWDDKTLDQLFVDDMVLYKNTSGTIRYEQVVYAGS